jgi:microcystin-dependent protein
LADPFVAEIRVFPFNFAPKGWAFCNGQLLPLSQNTALFSLLGTTYGGDGKSTFALPNLEGSAPIHPGQGPGLSLYDLGQIGGSQTVTLLESEMPSHNHSVMTAPDDPAESNAPFNNVLSRSSLNIYSTTSTPIVQMAAPQALGSAGGSLPHNNMMPYLTLSFCIALQGVFPPRP